jgi:hypothetical protein
MLRAIDGWLTEHFWAGAVTGFVLGVIFAVAVVTPVVLLVPLPFTGIIAFLLGAVAGWGGMMIAFTRWLY